MTAILGISAFYHDSAAALVIDGEIVAAAQEERFTGKKHDQDFPAHAIDYCLEAAGLRPEQLDYVGFYDKPLLKFDRLLETYFAYSPRGFRSFVNAVPVWLNKKLYLGREMKRALRGAYRKRFIYTEHHESHAASAFFPSPFDEAAILTLDGVGEWATATYGYGKGNKITLLEELRFPHSPGLLYSAFTYFCGFQVNSGEYKLMGLAPYGEPKYVDRILERLIDLKEDGSFRMDMSYFNYCQGLTMTSQKFEELFEGAPRDPEAPITQRDMDLAASIQKVIEEIMLRMSRHVQRETGLKNLCLAGGVALNCVGNGRILRETPFENLWIQPAAGDAGGSLGVALFVWHQLLENPRKPLPTDSQSGSLLGPSYEDEQIGAFLEGSKADYQYVEGDEALCEYVADEIADGKVVGWFQGRMEFGPRALGSRSILGDARRLDMQSVMNVKVKFREGFRPFAPVVLREHAGEYFDIAADQESPYMLLVTTLREEKRVATDGEQSTKGLDKLRLRRSQIPAVTHVDYSARLQTVDADRHGLLHQLLEAFYRRTACPVMVNTSFNLGWDPIVCSPRQAYETFMSSDIDLLCMGHYVLNKQKQVATVRTAAHAAKEESGTSPWLSPCHSAELTPNPDDAGLQCAACGQVFRKQDGIWSMYWPHEGTGDGKAVTETVKAFYEETPFPDYEDHDSLRSLIEKARRGLYARVLDQAIPYNSAVLEVGCGTGQLSNFLGIGCRNVVGADLCLNSLRLGEQFRRHHALDRVQFVQMNLFRPCLKPAQFDALLCNGVLHHTPDPYGGFRSLLPLLKPGGHCVVSLYNKYGRLMTDLRRQVFRLTGGRGKWIDPVLRNGWQGEAKSRAWFADRYRHPHESKHTVGEVLRWFDECGIEFVRGVPSISPGKQGFNSANLFDPEPRGTPLDHSLTQAREVISGSREGGFFLMIGRKAA